jgi:hypothetical protein
MSIKKRSWKLSQNILISKNKPAHKKKNKLKTLNPLKKNTLQVVALCKKFTQHTKP